MTPSARSRASDPEEMTGTSATPLPSSGMIDPLPNCFSIAATAVVTDLSFSLITLDTLIGSSF